MNAGRQVWQDEAAGPLVRPYAVTRGRIRPTACELDLVTLVVALRDRVELVDGEPEHTELLRLCQHPLSVAEVAAQVSLPLAAVKVLLGDLIEHRYLIFRAPLGPSRAHDPRFLQAVIDGIRNL